MLKLNELKQNRAITLVALIITIIVMLILVGVSISVLINSDLIGTAQNAGDRTETAYEEEGNLGAITVGDKSYASIQDYLDGNIMPDWEPIYTGENPTTDGQLMISDKEVFSGLYKYRITLDGYEEPIECLAIKIDEAEGLTGYILFAIADGEIETFTSTEEVYTFFGDIQSNPNKYQSVMAITGVNITGAGSMIMTIDKDFNPITTPITITKIERKTLSSHNWKYIDNTMAKIKCTCVECREVNKEGVILTIGQDAANYTAGPEGTEWIVFGTEDQDANGLYESVLITTKTVLETETLNLEGADAYINGIAQIEAKVDEIYGTEARGMTIEDVNRTLGYMPTGGMYTYDYSTYQYYNGFDTTYREYLTEYCTWNYKKENSIAEDLNEAQKSEVEAEVANILSTQIGPEDGKAVGEYKINAYTYGRDANAPAIALVQGVEMVPATTSNTVKSIVFGSSNNMYYWLASRGIFANATEVVFGVGGVGFGICGSCQTLYTSTGRSNSEKFPVRPVVSLGANALSVIGE